MSKLRRFIDRNQLALRKALWRLRHDYSPNARPVFILGAQRSGTTMLIKCLNQSLELEVFGEASIAMEDWRIRDLPAIEALIRKSRHRAVVFKPLTDSHRAQELMSTSESARAIWMYRRAADRANSAVARFGNNNLEHLSAFARGERMDTWQAQGMSAESVALISRFNYENMSPHAAAGLFWYIRNMLYFEQALEADDRVLPLAYEDLVERPQDVMRAVADFVGCRFEPALYDSIHSRSVSRAESRLTPEIESLCESLYARLRDAQRSTLARIGLAIE